MKNFNLRLKIIILIILLFSNSLYSKVVVKADSMCYGGGLRKDSGYAKLGIKTTKRGEKEKVKIFIRRKDKAYHLPLPIKVVTAENFNLMYFNVNLGYGLNLKKGDILIIKTKTSGNYNIYCK